MAVPNCPNKKQGTQICVPYDKRQQNLEVFGNDMMGIVEVSV